MNIDAQLYISVLDLDARSQGFKKAKTSVSVILQSRQLIWTEFGVLLRVISLIELIFVLSCSLKIQGKRPYKHDFLYLGIKKKKEQKRSFLPNLFC